MSPIIKTLSRLAVPLAALLLTACGGGINSQRDPGAALGRYTVGGAVSGLTGSVVLQNNGRDNLTVAANGNFTFTEKFSSGNTYAVSVLTQPVGQTCSVSSGAGTISGNNVNNVAVICSSNAYTVGGTVSGLSGTVVLQNNNGDNLTISNNGVFTFATAVAQGSPYAVTVLTQPSGQSCSVANGTGTIAGANVGNVVITCAANVYTVGGTVSGLSGTVVLQNNNGDNLTVSANGNFTFASAINDGGAYAVTVLTQPTGQTCTVSAGAGAVSGGNVTSVVLVCATNTFEVVIDAGATGGGTWSGTNPDIFTSNASVATVSVTDIQSRLNAGIPVTIITSPAALGNGDISVNSAVSWSANALTLKARRNITFNAALNGSGTAGLALEYGQGAVAAGNTAVYTLSRGMKVNLPAGANFSTRRGSDGVTTNWTVITGLGAAGDATVAPGIMTVQGMNTGLAGNYALGADIDASGTSAWNAGVGFTAVGTSAARFTGSFDGLGHTITGLTINYPGWNLLANSYVGLFGYADAGSTLRNVGLLNSSIAGANIVGALAGRSDGAISYAYADGGSVSASVNLVGGLVGALGGTGSISNSYTNVSVTGTNYACCGGGVASTAVGGLVGMGVVGFSVSNSYATGSVSGGTDVGGLVGQAATGTISNSYATGAVSGSTYVGGLSGSTGNGSQLVVVTNSYWDTQTSGRATSYGGTGKTTAEMKTQATFSGWDFVGIWRMVEGVSYPTLR